MRIAVPEYLGLTDEAYTVWFIAPRALPVILAARRAGGPLRAFVELFYQQLRAAADPADRPAVFTLAHWLGRPEEAATMPVWSGESRAAAAG